MPALAEHEKHEIQYGRFLQSQWAPKYSVQLH